MNIHPTCFPRPQTHPGGKLSIDTEHPFLARQMARCPETILGRAARLGAKVTAIAGAGTGPALAAARAGVESGLMDPLFIGRTDDILAKAEAVSWDLSDYRIVDAGSEEEAAAAAVDACRDGTASLLMKGLVHSDILMKAVLDRNRGLRTGNRLVHVFVLFPRGGGRPLAISDAAVNVAPDFDTRKSATRRTIDILRRLGVQRPRIAFLSATETPIAAVPSSIEARDLRDWARAELSDAEFSGPLATDLALSPEAARIKNIQGDPVAGHADGIIVPDLVSGNALYKALVYVAGACAGGVVTGASVPILLTSRADPPEARLASLALAVMMAEN